MAGENRGSPSHLKRDLLQHGHEYSFFQVMRLLRLFDGSPARSEGAVAGERDHIKIRPTLSLSFPAADVDSIEELDDDRNRFVINTTFLGLYGSSSPLPTFYTEDLIDEAAADGSVARDFLDVVNHRLFLLLFESLIKYRQFLQVAEENNHEYLERLYCLLGIGEEQLREDIIDPYELIGYMGLFTQFPRSALGLKILLQDAFHEINVDVIPCIERRAKIPTDQRICLGVSGGLLGNESFLGEEVADRMGKFRLRLEPVSGSNFRDFLPGGVEYAKLLFLTKLYIVEPLEYDFDLVIPKGCAKTVCLGSSEWSKLGLDTWIFSGDELEEVTIRICPE